MPLIASPETNYLAIKDAVGISKKLANLRYPNSCILALSASTLTAQQFQALLWYHQHLRLRNRLQSDNNIGRITTKNATIHATWSDKFIYVNIDLHKSQFGTMNILEDFSGQLLLRQLNIPTSSCCT